MAVVGMARCVRARVIRAVVSVSWFAAADCGVVYVFVKPTFPGPHAYSGSVARILPQRRRENVGEGPPVNSVSPDVTAERRRTGRTIERGSRRHSRSTEASLPAPKPHRGLPVHADGRRDSFVRDNRRVIRPTELSSRAREISIRLGGARIRRCATLIESGEYIVR